jgi:hypothetical protein
MLAAEHKELSVDETYLAFGKLLRALYTLLSRSCTSTSKALSSNFFSSFSRDDPGKGVLRLIVGYYLQLQGSEWDRLTNHKDFLSKLI